MNNYQDQAANRLVIGSYEEEFDNWSNFTKEPGDEYFMANDSFGEQQAFSKDQGRGDDEGRE